MEPTCQLLVAFSLYSKLNQQLSNGSTHCGDKGEGKVRPLVLKTLHLISGTEEA